MRGCPKYKPSGDLWVMFVGPLFGASLAAAVQVCLCERVNQHMTLRYKIVFVKHVHTISAIREAAANPGKWAQVKQLPLLMP
mmetsp:Transcript_14313/g.48957  ORF Transcript_14313/g.48957 Transcript_14313/m.48957 type:complete len:82 (+) Transcript_14313:783-1028(+)